VKIVAARLRERVIESRLADWPRIVPSRHRATPASAGFGSSRFSSPLGSFRVLYAADDFPTAFAEAVVRDRFEGKARRFLYRPHLEQLCMTSISSSRELALLDLRDATAYEVGIDTDAKGARAHTAGQALSEAVHAEMNDIDGIVFDSRLTTGACVAIYDRAFLALSGTPPVALLRAVLLPAELVRLDITVRRKRGYARPCCSQLVQRPWPRSQPLPPEAQPLSCPRRRQRDPRSAVSGRQRQRRRPLARRRRPRAVETLDSLTTDICFGGRALRTAWITLGSSGMVTKMVWPVEGLRLVF